ncbi:hypothetical protein X743_33435 [Mesorhizobium sp. LNHC252B00]|nr:hypothetical protein X743_33435 [Mesorhizobium sp. LNHC252B00]
MTSIDVNIRVDPAVCARILPEDVKRTVGDNLVDIHVDPDADRSLKKIHHDLLGVAPVPNFDRGSSVRIHNVSVQSSEISVRGSRGLLNVPESIQGLGCIPPLAEGDVEVLLSPDSESAVEAVGRNL